MAQTNTSQSLVIDTKEKLDAWTGDIPAWNSWGASYGGESFTPLDAERPVTVQLQNDAVFCLFNQGQIAWNKWVEANQGAIINFENFGFDRKSSLSFRRRCFPEGGIRFYRCDFFDCDINFGGANFGKCEVNFCGNKFSGGKVTFNGAHLGTDGVDFWDNSFEDTELHFQESNFSGSYLIFGKADFKGGALVFSRAKFGSADLSFAENNFTDAGIDFANITFTEGQVRFAETSFGKEDLDFEGADFGAADISFHKCEFTNETTNFESCDFGSGNLIISESSFRSGALRFADADFSETNVVFREVGFGTGSVDFMCCEFGKSARFDKLYDLEKLKSFSFEGCSFAKLFTFSLKQGSRMGCPLDLRRTSLKHDVVVHDINCDYTRSEWPARFLRSALERDDSQRFRKLKELAVANRNHAKALEFHAQEIQAARGHYDGVLKNTGATLAQFLYWISSDYGRSVKAPMGWLLGLWFVWGQLLWLLREQGMANFSEAAKGLFEQNPPDNWTALTYSASNMLSFIPTGRTARSQAEELLFGGFVPEYIIALNGVQTVLSVILLFLLGVGLRNMFRV